MGTQRWPYLGVKADGGEGLRQRVACPWLLVPWSESHWAMEEAVEQQRPRSPLGAPGPCSCLPRGCVILWDLGQLSSDLPLSPTRVAGHGCSVMLTERMNEPRAGGGRGAVSAPCRPSCHPSSLTVLCRSPSSGMRLVCRCPSSMPHCVPCGEQVRYEGVTSKVPS